MGDEAGGGGGGRVDDEGEGTQKQRLQDPSLFSRVKTASEV